MLLQFFLRHCVAPAVHGGRNDLEHHKSRSIKNRVFPEKIRDGTDIRRIQNRLKTVEKPEHKKNKKAECVCKKRLDHMLPDVIRPEIELRRPLFSPLFLFIPGDLIHQPDFVLIQHAFPPDQSDTV